MRLCQGMTKEALNSFYSKKDQCQTNKYEIMTIQAKHMSCLENHFICRGQQGLCYKSALFLAFLVEVGNIQREGPWIMQCSSNIWPSQGEPVKLLTQFSVGLAAAKKGDAGTQEQWSVRELLKMGQQLLAELICETLMPLSPPL